jgi:hypothetical protein
MKVIPDVIMTTLSYRSHRRRNYLPSKKNITIVFRDSIYFDELNGDSIFQNAGEYP